MLPRKICFFGLHILFIIHIANSFVLLTANMDDLKKLARKFVSDQFAEKIVELIAKATSGLLTPAPNMSEENEANVEEIQKVSDNEVMDPYKGVQRPKLGLRTTTREYADYSREVVKPKQIKVNSQYAETDLRSQELTELSEYRNPLKLPLLKPQEESPERNIQKPMNILRQNPQPQYLDGDNEDIKFSNIEQKRPKISYHKSKVPDKNRNIDAQYESVNVGGENREQNNLPAPDDRYYPASEDRNPKILDLQYQNKKDIQQDSFGSKKDTHQDNFGKVEPKEVKMKESIKKDKKIKAKSEEYLDKVKKLAEQDKTKILDLQYKNKKDINRDYFAKVEAKEYKMKESIKKDKKIKAKSEEYLDKVKKLAEQDKTKILDLQYKKKKDINRDYFAKVEAKEYKIKESIKKDKNKKRKAKSEEYLDKVKKLAERDREDKHYNNNNKKLIGKVGEKPKAMERINFNPRIRSESSKNGTLQMFVQKGGQLEEVSTMTTERPRMGFDQYQPRSMLKHATRSRKNRNKS